MTIAHTKILPGEGWYSIATRLSPPGITLTQRTMFTNKLLTSNGLKISDPTTAGRILHYDTDDIPVVAAPLRNPTRVPFVPSSPFNTPTPANAVWTEVPILNNMLVEVNGSKVRYLYGGEGQLNICHGLATDPEWTITMPEFGNDDPRFNRHWLPATWKMHLPAAGPVIGGNEDSIISMLDESTGEYAEVGNAKFYTINKTDRTIIGQPEVWWARGNVDTGLGVGGLLSEGKNSAGVRAANFSWMAGAITGYDVAQVLSGKKTDFGHALALMLTQETLSTWGVTPPATAPNNGYNNGPIKMGARIGIPAGVAKPAGMGTDLLGVAFWNTMQKYGALVGDFTGGPWPIFQIDVGSVDPVSLHSMWVWWEGNPAAKYVVPCLRVTEG